MKRAQVGWAAVVTGDSIDVQTFRVLLRQPFDPWVEDFEHEEKTLTILMSKAWAGLTSAEVVHRDATRIVSRLNGAYHLLHTDAKPVELGRLFKFDDQGNSVPFTLLLGSQASVHVTSGARAFSEVLPSQTPTESKLQQWLRESETDEFKADLLAHVQRADNWYDIYKCMELGRKIVGGDGQLRARLGSDKKRWDVVRQTANHFRHAPGTGYCLPPDPPPFAEAREFALKTISSLV